MQRVNLHCWPSWNITVALELKRCIDNFENNIGRVYEVKDQKNWKNLNSLRSCKYYHLMLIAHISDPVKKEKEV